MKDNKINTEPIITLPKYEVEAIVSINRILAFLAAFTIIIIYHKTNNFLTAMSLLIINICLDLLYAHLFLKPRQKRYMLYKNLEIKEVSDQWNEK